MLDTIYFCEVYINHQKALINKQNLVWHEFTQKKEKIIILYGLLFFKKIIKDSLLRKQKLTRALLNKVRVSLIHARLSQSGVLAIQGTRRHNTRQGIDERNTQSFLGHCSSSQFSIPVTLDLPPSRYFAAPLPLPPFISVVTNPYCDYTVDV
jgi:hypothetical protein